MKHSVIPIFIRENTLFFAVLTAVILFMAWVWSCVIPPTEIPVPTLAEMALLMLFCIASLLVFYIIMFLMALPSMIIEWREKKFWRQRDEMQALRGSFANYTPSKCRPPSPWK